MASSNGAASRSELAERMAGAAADLVTSLGPDQRAIATWPFPSDDERMLWFYTPTDHGGLPLSAMSAAQQRLTHRLVASGLSEAGYVTTAAIMGLENVLDAVEGWQVDWGRERGRDPQLYYVSIFGSPGDDVWAWRFGGHHVSISHLILRGEVAGSTPCFLGADPASAPLLGPHLHRPLAAAEDLGRELIHALDADQRRDAIASPVAPSDIVGANRTRLADGDRPLPLTDVWRGAFDGALGDLVAGAQAGMDAALGTTDETLDAVRITSAPRGVPGSALRPDQHDIMRVLLDQYLDRLPDSLADGEKAKFAGERISDLSFLWAGGIDVGDPHYYRIQGGDLLIEYDNTARDANHVHTVWRDLRNDFGLDVLAQHYATHH